MIPRLGAFFLVLAFCAPVWAQNQGDASLDDPFTPSEFAAAIRQTIGDCTVSAMVGPAPTPLPLHVSNFLLDRPELAAFIVNRRKIAPYRIEMLGPRRSSASDGRGTTGVVNLIERSDTHRLYYGEGVHQSLLFPDLHATAVVEMSLHEEPGPDGRPRTVTTFQVFVRLRNRFVSSVVKTLSPFLRATIAGKFTKAFAVANRVALLMTQDPDVIADDIRACPSVFIEDRAALIELIARLKPAWTGKDAKR